MKCKKIILKQMYNGFPKKSDFEIVDEDVAEDLQNGEFLYESLAISVDPYIRAYAGAAYKPGDTVIGTALVRVTKSKNEQFQNGKLLVLHCGWRNGGKAKESDVLFVRDDMPASVPESAGLGLYGIAGLTAWVGWILVCKIKEGETIFISGAAGAVGNVAAQIGKIKGCTVVGSCGTDEKVKFCKNIGYDAVFNYKKESESLDAAIKRVAPKGIDCYFDNVGGSFSSTILRNMNSGGRVGVCGSISAYNETTPVLVPILQPTIGKNELILQGFRLRSHESNYKEAYEDLKKWTIEGKMKNYEKVTKGFENVPDAFIDMLRGGNVGKAVVRL
uniref:prostaglandin reductase 1-like isoform X2 n=1 Tax=Styela clava TaxID=7725 RepID=UPI0019397230|nr:prostaglandin reductase 1-like isoform X2 [Styela clava]